MYDTRLCWLPFLPTAPDAGHTDTVSLARAELALGLSTLQAGCTADITLLPGMGEGYEIAKAPGGYTVRGGETGVLYGVYRLLMQVATGRTPETAWTQPVHALRMLNHWDNMDGGIERGYAGRSFFFRDGRFAYDPDRVRQYGRMLASIGVNAITINNVNVHAPADALILPELLPEVAKLADLLRPFGVRLILSVDFSLPMRHGLTTADPLNEEVRAWWQACIDDAYRAVPDLCGLLVKADSEHRPGPYRYGRNHAEGAGLFSGALKPHGGVLVWRCFVYDCMQDWRNQAVDRPKAAYDNYVGLDGQFDDNVILQVKNGPFDFQVREPVSPLLYAMPRTVKALELQLTQEYTGHQIDLFYMGPQWAQIMQDLGGSRPAHIAAVVNVGDDANWTGHDLAQANLFAYGRLAWEGRAEAEDTAAWWAALTFGTDPMVMRAIPLLLIASGHAYEQYTAPLGLCWMVTPNGHYGPSPEGYEYSAWGTYLRTTRDAVGTDRTSTGTGYTAQYPPEIAARYEDITTCPDELLLFFHRLPYTHVMRDGRTLIQRIYDDHFDGAQRAEEFQMIWMTLMGKVPDVTFAAVGERFARQVKNAREWRDVINTYFHRYCSIDDARGRKIYP